MTTMLTIPFSSQRYRQPMPRPAINQFRDGNTILSRPDRERTWMHIRSQSWQFASSDTHTHTYVRASYRFKFLQVSIFLPIHTETRTRMILNLAYRGEGFSISTYNIGKDTGHRGISFFFFYLQKFAPRNFHVGKGKRKKKCRS